MRVEDVNNLGVKINFDKMMKNNREEIEKKIVENIDFK